MLRRTPAPTERQVGTEGGAPAGAQRALRKRPHTRTRQPQPLNQHLTCQRLAQVSAAATRDHRIQARTCLRGPETPREYSAREPKFWPPHLRAATRTFCPKRDHNFSPPGLPGHPLSWALSPQGHLSGPVGPPSPETARGCPRCPAAALWLGCTGTGAQSPHQGHRDASELSFRGASECTERPLPHFHLSRGVLHQKAHFTGRN